MYIYPPWVGWHMPRVAVLHLKVVLLDLYLLGQVGFLEMLCGWVGRYKQLTVNN
jgi:hypothetical protein